VAYLISEIKISMNGLYYFYHILYSIFFVFLATTILHAGSQEEIFLRANKLYQQHKFQDALTLYTTLSSKGPVVWENMGNCAYYLEDYSHAIAYWYRTQRYADRQRHSMIKERIQQAYHHLKIVNDDSWYEKVESWIVKYIRIMPLWMWELLLITSWAFLMLAGPLLYKRDMRSTLLGLAGITFFCVMLYGTQYIYEQRNFGIVIFSHASLHTGAHEQLPVIATLKLGQKVRVADVLHNWYRISVGQHIGWIPKNMIEVV